MYFICLGNKIKENNLLKTTNKTLSLNLVDENHSHTWLFTPDLERNVLDFSEKAILGEIDKSYTDAEKYDIVFKKADFEDSKDDFGKIFNLINKTSANCLGDKILNSHPAKSYILLSNSCNFINNLSLRRF